MAGIRAVAFQDFCCSNGCLAQCSCSALCPSRCALIQPWPLQSEHEETETVRSTT